MSVSVVAIPFALQYIVAGFLAATAIPTIRAVKEAEQNLNGDINLENDVLEKYKSYSKQKECNEHIVISESNFMDKTF